VFPAHHNRWVTFDCYGTLLDRASARPLSDVEPLLAELRRRRYKLGVLTNRDGAEFEAAHRAFTQPFDLFVTADRIRARKPELWHFRAFERLAQVQKENWIHVSSDVEKDIVPAGAFGIQRVWLDRSGTGEGASRATAHVRTTAEAVRAIDWMFQECAACAS
jgi:FMN phosphatase YigB (HAD superfamily)